MFLCQATEFAEIVKRQQIPQKQNCQFSACDICRGKDLEELNISGRMDAQREACECSWIPIEPDHHGECLENSFRPQQKAGSAEREAESHAPGPRALVPVHRPRAVQIGSVGRLAPLGNRLQTATPLNPFGPRLFQPPFSLNTLQLPASLSLLPNNFAQLTRNLNFQSSMGLMEQQQSSCICEECLSGSGPAERLALQQRAPAENQTGAAESGRSSSVPFRPLQTLRTPRKSSRSKPLSETSFV